MSSLLQLPCSLTLPMFGAAQAASLNECSRLMGLLRDVAGTINVKAPWKTPKARKLDSITFADWCVLVRLVVLGSWYQGHVALVGPDCLRCCANVWCCYLKCDDRFQYTPISLRMISAKLSLSHSSLTSILSTPDHLLLPLQAGPELQ